MEYQRIKYFLKAAKTQNFSKAAKEMYISPQALTKQISLLEEELGVKLFERSTRNVHLTELGVLAENKLGQIDKELKLAVSEIRKAGEVLTGKVRVGIFSALPKEEFITPILTLILANVPNSHIELKMMELFDIQKDMMEGKLDLAFTNAHEEEDWGSCHKLVFHTVPAQIVVSLYHPWAVKDEITEEDMKKETFLKMDHNAPYKKEVGNDGFYYHIPCREVVTVPNFITLLTMLSQAEGFAVFPKAFHDSHTAKFKYFDVPGKDFRFQTACFYHKDSLNPNITPILQLIRDEFNVREADFHGECCEI